MQILFQHSFEEPVWQLVQSRTPALCWLAETRSAVTKTVSYQFINSEFQLSTIADHLGWWSAIEALIGTVAIFHGFLQEDLPVHKGVTIVNGENGTLLWENEYIRYLSANEQFLKGLTTFSQEKQQLFDLQTGELVTEEHFEELPKDTAVLSVYTEADAHFSDICTFICRYTPYTPGTFFEYFETDTHLFISYYVSKQQLLDNYLLVTNTAGEELLHLCLSENLSGIATGTFNVSNGMLSFVKDLRELFLISLEKKY